jgi:hypothetical protein
MCLDILRLLPGPSQRMNTLLEFRAFVIPHHRVERGGVGEIGSTDGPQRLSRLGLGSPRNTTHFVKHTQLSIDQCRTILPRPRMPQLLLGGKGATAASARPLLPRRLPGEEGGTYANTARIEIVRLLFCSGNIPAGAVGQEGACSLLFLFCSYLSYLILFFLSWCPGLTDSPPPSPSSEAESNPTVIRKLFLRQIVFKTTKSAFYYF